MQTGSDRDATSIIYDVPAADSNAQTRAELGIVDTQLTYGVVVDLSKPTPRIVGSTGAFANFVRSLDGTDGAQEAIAIYDMDKVQAARLPGGGRVFHEVWFNGNANDALLLVVRQQ